MMAALHRNPEGLTMGALSEALLVTNGNVTQIAKALVRDGLIELRKLPGDRRSSVATLTPEGKQQFQRLARAHGDWIEQTRHGGYIIYGRSDAVLNPGGVRIGTAEIYRQVEQLEEVEEAITVCQDWQGDVRVVLFVKLREGLTLDDALVAKIKKRIRDHTTPRHVPDKVLQVGDIPRTKSGKIVELAVRNVVHGQPVRNVEALANPEALEQFRDRQELADL